MNLFLHRKDRLICFLEITNIYIFSKTGNGDWSIISESYGSNTYTYAVQMSVENNQDIALLNPIVINTENIISNDPLEITVDVVNWGFDDFNGIVDINLFNLNGEHELTIDQGIHKYSFRVL